ncbi:DDE-type integrase/transposase/recombinase [Uliginosibacterium sp. H3]|uniref:DDE-type integrase/transposase/recombinase n=1 Tax=Uliginosibacterium silvisoli TaxID=3114758 RepID=A0ABU6K7Y1_9RHOO|nr:DDE-type integrase/transposase/recombinase [Uliginosibacterium sp. H3]
MLEHHHRDALLDRLGLPPKGRRIVVDAVRNSPVRPVKSRGGNVLTTYQSRKMQRESNTESRHLEFPAAVTYEHDPDVLEFFAQPCHLKFEVIDDQGEIHKIDHIPDFLIIRADGVFLHEWKSEEKLQGLARRTPWRYQLNDDGQWRSPYIEHWLADRGITYQICTETRIGERRIENTLFLEDYLHPSAMACPIDAAMRVESALKEDATLYLAELYEKAQCTPDDAFKLIADGILIADMDGEFLAEPHRCRVFRDHAVRDFERALTECRARPQAVDGTLDLRVGARVLYNHVPYEISLVGVMQIVLKSEHADMIELKLSTLGELAATGNLKMENACGEDLQRPRLCDFTENELRTALSRQSDLSRESLSPRTRARFKKLVTHAEIAGLDTLTALVPRTRDRGNRTARLSPEQLDAIAEITRKHFLNSKAQNRKACHNHLIALCREKQIEAPSYPTLIAHFKKLPRTGADRARYGKRVAYKNAEFVSVLHADTPVHGVRPFQYVHMDHTEVDIELVCSRTGKGLGRPWLSFAIDAFTRRILGMYLSFDSPSYRSNMMLFRDIVRRFRRLPQMVVVDNGADFRSEDFSLFAKLMRIHVRYRPAGNPRHGAVMERIFGSMHTEYVHNLAGNTKATKNVRETTGKFLPSRLAEWTLEQLYYGIEYWATEYYDQREHPALGLSPRDAYAQGMAQSGERSHCIVTLTKAFLILTCPLVERAGVRKVDKQRGIKMNDRYFYWCPEFSNPKLHGTKVAVRYDPWDVSTVFVQVDKRWHPATCKTLAHLHTMTEKERAALSEEYVNRYPNTKHDELSVQRLVEFMRTFTPEGARALQLARQQENRQLYQSLGLAEVAPRGQLLLSERSLTTFHAVLSEQSVGLPVPVTIDKPAQSHTLPLDDDLEMF